MTDKKMTIEQLIKQAENPTAKDKKQVEIFVKSMDATITAVEPDEDKALELGSKMAKVNTDDIDKMVKICDELIYECVTEPNLKDKTLHQAYGVKRPSDIVSKIFSKNERLHIGTEIMNLSDLADPVKLVDSLKNE